MFSTYREGFDSPDNRIWVWCIFTASDGLFLIINQQFLDDIIQQCKLYIFTPDNYGSLKKITYFIFGEGDHMTNVRIFGKYKDFLFCIQFWSIFSLIDCVDTCMSTAFLNLLRFLWWTRPKGTKKCSKGRRDRDHMVVGFTTTCAIIAYHHHNCQV
jgi:hypothetical protein